MADFGTRTSGPATRAHLSLWFQSVKSSFTNMVLYGRAPDDLFSFLLDCWYLPQAVYHRKEEASHNNAIYTIQFLAEKHINESLSRSH